MSNASVFSARTSVRSILRPYKATQRDKALNRVYKDVRFLEVRKRGLQQTLQLAKKTKGIAEIDDFITHLETSVIHDEEYTKIMQDARQAVLLIGAEYVALAEALLLAPWLMRSRAAALAYCDYCLDLLAGQSKYAAYAMHALVKLWLPQEPHAEHWPDGTPNGDLHENLKLLHGLLERVMDAVPLACGDLVCAIERQFPPYKKPPYQIAGFVHNVMWLLDYKPLMYEFVLPIVLHELVKLDALTPREHIEDVTEDAEADENDEQLNVAAPEMEPQPLRTLLDYELHIAHALDLSMAKMLAHFKRKLAGAKAGSGRALFKQLLAAFDQMILPSHNTHHVQFLLFYYCSVKPTYAEQFLSHLWHIVQDPNISTVLRKAAVDYIASFLARAKYVPLKLIQSYLEELCGWACHYISVHDFNVKSLSIKASLVFYSVCQAIFYTIAFRSKLLTSSKKDLKRLAGLDLQHIINCKLNPLRVCLPAVAAVFADVTRNYQIAYCHSIIEHNKRSKLATVYANEIATVEESLDTVYPYDPYLLRVSLDYIEPIYEQWNGAENYHNIEAAPAQHEQTTAEEQARRRRTYSEISDSGLDELLSMQSHKRRKIITDDSALIFASPSKP